MNTVSVGGMNSGTRNWWFGLNLDYMSHGLNCLKGGIEGTIVRVIKGDTRSSV